MAIIIEVISFGDSNGTPKEDLKRYVADIVT